MGRGVCRGVGGLAARTGSAKVSWYSGVVKRRFSGGIEVSGVAGFPVNIDLLDEFIEMEID